MIRTYRWVLHAEAVEAFQSRNKRRRAQLIRQFENLAAHPFLEPKIRSRDAEYGEVSTVFDGGMAIHYHVDQADRRVNIFRLDEEPTPT